MITHNIGNANALNAVLTATVPPNTTPVSIDAGGRFENGQAVWSTSSLPPTGPITLQFAVRTDEDIRVNSLLVSKANISATNAAPKSASVTTVVVGEPDVNVLKRGEPVITAGEDLDYSITVKNQGLAIARETRLIDQLPVGTTYKSAQPAPDTVAGQTVIWELGNLLRDETRRIDLTVSTDPNGVPSVLNNLVEVTDLTRDSDVSEWQTQERASTVLDVTITPDQPTHRTGETVVYTVTWANNGSIDVTGAQVEAWLPPDTTYQSATNGGGLAQDQTLAPHVEWAVGDLAHGATGQATFTIDIGSNVASGTRLDSAADIRANAGLPDSDNAVVDVVDDPILLLSKSVDRTTAAIGDSVTFTVSYRNSGNGPLTGVTVVDTLPAGLEATTASDGGTISADGATVTWDLADIAAGTEGTLTVGVTVTQALNDEVVNSVTLSSNELPDETATATLGASNAQPVLPVPIDQRWLWLLAMLMGAMVMARGRYRFGR